MLSQVRGGTDDLDIIDRDLVALRGFKGVLRSLLSAQNLFRALNLEAEVETTWSDFLNDLKSALGTATVNRSPNRSGRVLVTTVADARGLPHKHVFIPGLSEGLFPLPTPEDPLYLDSERRGLTARGIPLETQAERAADEGLFYELINLAQETLTLSRPTVQNGALWPESHLWRAVRLLFTDSAALIERDRIALGAAIKAADVASHSEAALVVASALNTPALKPDDAALYNWLVNSHDEGWRRIRTARQIERGRMTRRDFDHYSGVLRAAHLREWAAAELGARRVWSASQFNDYGQCGFRFFAKRMLKLEKLEEPEEGMDAAQLGTLNHAILEETYRRLGAVGVTITPDHAETALATLREVASEKLRTAPQEIGFRASALWEQEQASLLRRLEALVRLDFSEDSPVNKVFGDTPRQPYLLESPFSTGAQNVIELLIHPDIGKLRVTGYIDRMDRQGERVILIDYKSGSTTIPTKEMQRGRNFQMMLYLLAGQVILGSSDAPDTPRSVAGGLFWHLRSGKPSGAIQTALPDDAQAIDEGREQLAAHIARGRAGRFAVHPNKASGGHCSHYCEFSEFCRVSIMRRTRGEG
ncbi:MAG: PD-(D/E)XK nuclease family protein [Anaerolineae bacterium]|nr:PD-(D/E)XK nuclease family protein [Anaerolineae bacterium]